MIFKAFFLYLCMEKEEPKAGRPKLDPALHKKNRAVSLTDKEYEKLKNLASEDRLGVSAYVIKKLKLS